MNGESNRGATAVRFAMAVVLLVTISGALAVAAQELAPAGMGWLLTLAGHLIAAIASGLGVYISGHHGKASGSTGGKPPRSAVKTVLLDPRFWVALTTSAIIVWWVSSVYDPTKQASPPPPPPKGLDLGGYCLENGFERYRQNRCSTEIPREEICDWEHGTKDSVLVYQSNDPDTGVCLDKKGKKTKGVARMPDYCREKFTKLPGIELDHMGTGVYHCAAPVDMDLVCIEQHNDKTLRAVKQGKALVCLPQSGTTPPG
ncbi:hypothetical protein [Nonomuraea sp. NPDC050310]|uniref:hypothetical protein n=1 Tax=Nonomuraea sp. NPDC050310 TaxID=3154935 RepID=UPI0033D72B55